MKLNEIALYLAACQERSDPDFKRMNSEHAYMVNVLKLLSKLVDSSKDVNITPDEVETMFVILGAEAAWGILHNDYIINQLRNDDDF
jgi:hypothetical protein